MDEGTRREDEGRKWRELDRRMDEGTRGEDVGRRRRESDRGMEIEESKVLPNHVHTVYTVPSLLFSLPFALSLFSLSLFALFQSGLTSHTLP